MPTNSSDSYGQGPRPLEPSWLFGRQRTLHSLFGGGRVADILLWKNKTRSAMILAGFTTMWFLFEVAEFHFITLACYILMALMVIRFIWNYVAEFINKEPPTIRDIQVSEYTFRRILGSLNWFLITLHRISSGEDLAQFVMALGALWILSIMGNYSDAVNLLYISYLCLAIIPVSYERYEKEVGYIATQGTTDVKRFYREFDSMFLSKIPRKPVKEKKYK